MPAVSEGRKERGPELLLLHCAALSGVDETRPSAFERLQALVGEELAERLLEGLKLGGPRFAV